MMATVAKGDARPFSVGQWCGGQNPIRVDDDGAVSMSIQDFNLREWLAPPILVTAFLGLLIAGAVIIRW
jgi:hypothetical protein